MSQGPTSVTPPARQYLMVNPATNATQIVNQTQAQALTTAGWTQISEVGTTAQRPTTGLLRGMVYRDTTLNKLIVWVGGGGGIIHDQGGTEPGFWTDGTGAKV